MAKKLKLEVEFTVHDECSLMEAVFRVAVRLKQLGQENTVVVPPITFKDDLLVQQCQLVGVDGIRDR